MKSLFIGLALVIAGACSSHKQHKQEVREKVAESTVSDSQALGGTIQDLIQNSKTLSDNQKKTLEGILQENKKRAEELSQESYRYRSVLITELLAGNASPSKIKILKKDIKRIEDARLKNTFDTVEKISQIVSKDPEKRKFGDQLMMEPRFIK